MPYGKTCFDFGTTLSGNKVSNYSRLSLSLKFLRYEITMTDSAYHKTAIQHDFCCQLTKHQLKKLNLLQVLEFLSNLQVLVFLQGLEVQQVLSFQQVLLIQVHPKTQTILHMANAQIGWCERREFSMFENHYLCTFLSLPSFCTRSSRRTLENSLDG